MDRIFQYEDFFDLVVIIRGGGSKTDLGCFDRYLLASHICQFPLPVFTGIGHDQDETIVDLVAHTKLKTPTAVAEYVIGFFMQADDHINELTSILLENVRSQIDLETDKLNRFFLLFRPAVKEQVEKKRSNLRFLGIGITSRIRQAIVKHEASLSQQKYRLTVLSDNFISRQKHHIEMLTKKNSYLDPFLVLKRGYSVTYYNGQALRDPGRVKEQDTIITKLDGGTIKSKIVKKKEK